ncbi:MAG: flagellar motor switch protein FliG, partial [bacterium]
MPLNGYEKAAIFLSCVGEEAAAEALKDLNIREIGKITMHMARLKTVNTTTIDNVMKEASDMIDRGDLHIGGEEFVKKILSIGLGEDGATKILEMASKEGPLDSLKWVDSKT